MKHFKLIKKIAKLEYNLIFKALPKAQKDSVRDFFTSICTELSLTFPDHTHIAQNFTLEQFQTYQQKHKTGNKHRKRGVNQLHFKGQREKHCKDRQRDKKYSYNFKYYCQS